MNKADRERSKRQTVYTRVGLNLSEQMAATRKLATVR
jgi:hypothetical protein